MKSPYHYLKSGIQPLEYIIANDLSFIEGNIIKYVTRYKHKDGVEDLLKAQEYLKLLIEKNNDLIDSYGGNDIIDGGDGKDTFKLSGKFEDYTLSDKNIKKMKERSGKN